MWCFCVWALSWLHSGSAKCLIFLSPVIFSLLFLQTAVQTKILETLKEHFWRQASKNIKKTLNERATWYTGAEPTENSLVIAVESHSSANNSTDCNSSITNITRTGSSTSISICGSPELGVQSVTLCSPDQVPALTLVLSLLYRRI